MKIKLPEFMFHPKITRRALLAIYATTVAQVSILVGSKAIYAHIFGHEIAGSIVDVLEHVSAGLSGVSLLLSVVTAFGRSIAGDVDADKDPAATSIAPATQLLLRQDPGPRP